MNDIITITHGKERVVPSFPVGRYYTQQAKVNLANDVASMNSAMSKVAGSDGFIDPKDYLFAKKQWIAAGNDPKDFDDYFAVYRNPYDNYNTN